MIGWLIALAVVVLLAIAPLGVSVKYDASGPLARLIAGPLRVTVYPPRKKKEGNHATEEKKRKDKKEKKSESQPQEKSKAIPGGSITDFLPLVKIVLELLDDFRWKLRVNRLELKLVLAGDDPSDLAVNYGKAWAAIGNLWPRLEHSLVIKKRDVDVSCDFTTDKTLVTARMDLTITLGRLLCLGGKHGIRALREFLKIMKSRKGGSTK